MNSRILQIMSMLSENHSNSLISLSDQFHVTERTIRNDIKKINEFLIQNGLSRVKLDKSGIIIVANDFHQYQQYIIPDDYYNYRLSKSERVIVASIILLCKTEYTTISSIADTLYVSRTTLINDLASIKRFIKKYNVTLESHPSKGLLVTGDELDIREAIFTIFLSKKLSSDVSQLIDFKKLFDSEHSEMIIDILNEVQQELNIEFDNQSLSYLIFYLSIMIERNHHNKYIKYIGNTNHNKEHYNCAYIIIRNIARYCETDMNEGEINYLTSKLGSSFTYSSTVKGTRQAIAIQVLTKQLIHDVSNALHINLENDYQFYENLSNHMISIYQKSIQPDTENPLLNDIKENYVNLTNIVTDNIKDIETYFDRKLNETEILYIVIHFTAAIERLKSLRKDFNVIIVCNVGMATSQFLKEKLKSIFNMNIVATIAKYELDTIKNTDADLIISTVPLFNQPIKTVQVSTKLTNDDYASIGAELNKLQSQKMQMNQAMKQNTIDIPQIMNVVNPILTSEIPTRAQDISLKINKELANKFHTHQKENDGLYLYELLQPEFIRLNLDCDTWQNAIIESGKTLLEKSYISEAYIQTIIDMTKKLGPYYIIGPGVAMPHAGVDDGSFKTGMSMIRLNQPVTFDLDPQENQPIRYIIMMCSKDEHSHLKAFFHLLTLLHDTDLIQEMDTISSPTRLNYLLQIRELELKEY